MFNLDNNLLIDALHVFLGIIVEAFPFILIGVITSSLIHVFFKQENIIKLIPKNKFLSLLVGPFIGIIFPVCECGNIPLARRMALMKLPSSMILSFLFSAPIINPIVIISTLVAFNYDIGFILLRLGFGLGISLCIAYFFGKASDDELYNEDLFKSNSHNCCNNNSCSHEKHSESKGLMFFSNLMNEFIEMGGILIFGALIASFIQAVLSRDLIISLGTGDISSILSMQALAIITSICSNVDAFFALAYSNNFTTGSLLAFLVLGPMIDIKSFFMLRKIFKTKVIAFMSIIIIMLTFLLSLIYNFYFV